MKILSQYFVLGPYDFVNIFEAPDDEVISKVAIELGARGTLQTMTMAAMNLDTAQHWIDNYVSRNYNRDTTCELAVQ